MLFLCRFVHIWCQIEIVCNVYHLIINALSTLCTLHRCTEGSIIPNYGGEGEDYLRRCYSCNYCHVVDRKFQSAAVYYW